MTHIATTSSFRPVVDVHTFNRLYHTYSELTYSQQNYPPLAPNFYLGFSDPLHHATAPIPSKPFRPLYDPLKVSIPSLPSYLNPPLDESTAHNPVPASSFANGEPPYDIPSAEQPHLYQVDETTPEGLSPRLSALPHSSAPLTAPHPQSFPEPTNVAFGAMSASDQTQAQAAIHLPSTFHDFGGGDATLPAPPVPLVTASPTPVPSNTVHICQCETGGSPCNAAVSGNARAVRDHLNQVHEFRSTGKRRVVCLWAGCGKTLQRENIPRHIVTRHFRVRVSCVECGLSLSRRDVQYSHARACRASQTASQLDSGM